MLRVFHSLRLDARLPDEGGITGIFGLDEGAECRRADVLGLGVVEPTPSWGLMLSGVNADYYLIAPWTIIFPGLAISLAVFAFNMSGDSLRDWLDPKLKL